MEKKESRVKVIKNSSIRKCICENCGSELEYHTSDIMTEQWGG